VDSVWTWGGSVGNSWRVTGDIQNTWSSISSIANTAAGISQYSGPGGFNDLDMLVSQAAELKDTPYSGFQD
jgi:alpha-galactosidase